MHVLITSPVFPPDLGGPAVYVPSFARHLQDRGESVEVVAFCSEERPSGHPFPVHAIPRGPLALRYLKSFLRVLRVAGRADVVYVQEHLALLQVLAARLRRRPVVIRIMVDGAWEIAHRKGWCGGDDIVTFQGKDYGWRVRAVRALQRWWWGRASKIICCSEFLRAILVEHHGVAPAKVVTVLNAYHGPRAADVRETPAEARARLGLDPHRRYVLTICRLMVWKRVDNVIRALAEWPADVDLLVAGDGDMREAWGRLAAELGLAERVRFLGNVPHAEIPLWIRASDLFVLNSEYEGLSHTLLEVQALGTPIVASDVCGNPEVITDGVDGLLVDPRDVAELAAAGRRLLDEPSLGRELAARGTSGARRFDRAARFDEVLAILRAAASRGAHRRAAAQE